MQRFEYINFSSTFNDEIGKVHFVDGNTYDYSTDFDFLLDSLGEEGWELVSVVPLTESYKPWLLELSFSYTGGFVYYLKRELTDEIIKMRQQKKEEAEEFIETYLSNGYQLIYDHDNTIIFAKGSKEISFSYNKASGQWVEKK